MIRDLRYTHLKIIFADEITCRAYSWQLKFEMTPGDEWNVSLPSWLNTVPKWSSCPIPIPCIDFLKFQVVLLASVVFRFNTGLYEL